MNNNRKYQLAIWGIIIGGTAAAAALLLFVFGPIFPNGISFLLFAAMVFGAVFLALHIGKIYSQKISDKIQDILFEECDPERYIETINAYKEKEEGKNRAAFYLSLTNGLIHSGKHQEAAEILEGITKFPDTPYGKQLKAGCIYNLYSISIFKGENEKAEVLLSEFLNFLKEIELKPEETKRYYHNAALAGKTILNMSRGVYDDAEQTFLKIYEEADRKLTKVTSQYQLGTIYAHFQRYDEARRAFRYVIQNGNKVYAVARAKEQLEKLG